MTILRSECGHVKSCWDNHKRCIKYSSCSRESTCSTCSSWSDKTCKLAEERRTCTSRKCVMAKKKPYLIHQRKLDRITTPHGPAARGEDPSRWQLQGYLYSEEFKSIGHRLQGICPVDKKTSLTRHWSRVKWHYTRILKSVSHRSLAIQPLVIGHRGKLIFTGQPATSHQSSDFISTYI